MVVTSLPPSIMGNPFAFVANGCNKCHTLCCQLGEPVLFHYDLATLTHRFGDRLPEFIEERLVLHHAKRFFVRPGPMGCGFFDPQGSLHCSIFPIRPLDCRLFPLDFVLISGAPMRIVYDLSNERGGCNFAHLADEELARAARAAERRILPLISNEEFEIHAKYNDFSLFTEGHFKVLGRVDTSMVGGDLAHYAA